MSHIALIHTHDKYDSEHSACCVYRDGKELVEVSTYPDPVANYMIACEITSSLNQAGFQHAES